MSYKECKKFADKKKIKYNTLTGEFWIYADELETPLIMHKITELSKKKKEKLHRYLIENGFEIHQAEGS